MVMTEVQMATLKKQIAVYQLLSERLVQMYEDMKNSSAQPIPGSRTEEEMQYCNPPLPQVPRPDQLKITTRQRWSPTPMQLQVLEGIFEKEIGNGTPDRKKIREITSTLSQYGVISEANVYNWFQNRRARHKKIKKRKLSSSTRAAQTRNDSGTARASSDPKRLKTDDGIPSLCENPKSPAFDDQLPNDLDEFFSEMSSKDAEDDDAFALFSFDEDFKFVL